MTYGVNMNCVKEDCNLYLDYAATTPLSYSMKEYLIQLLDTYGNPSSLYTIGANSKKLISDTRVIVSKFIDANPNEIYFTPSGSASNTLAIKGYCLKHKCKVLYSPIAHKSILKCVETCKSKQALQVNKDGLIDLKFLKKCLSSTSLQCLVVIDYANSEIGTIQDVRRVSDLVHKYNGVVCFDCTGSIPSIPLDVQFVQADMATFSAHKLGGLKGCGVLYKKENIELEPLIYGAQENGLIGGTENILGIASLGKAIEEYEYATVTSENRDYIYNYLVENIQNCYIVGTIENRLPHNLYVCFKGIEGEALVMLMDLNGIQISTGSACNSGNLTASSTLEAIGLSENDIHSCVRITFNGNETKDELDYVCEKIKECVNRLRSLNTL